MSKRKIFISAGAIVLGVVGFLATSANKKFAGVKTAWFRTAGAAQTFVTLFHGIAANALHLTTTVTAGRTAFFQTGTAVHTLFATNSTTTLLYGK